VLEDEKKRDIFLLYVPFGSVARKHRNRLLKMLKRRTEYGTSEGILYKNYPDLIYFNYSSKVSYFVIFERFTVLETFVYSRNCQTLGVSTAKPGAYTI
jgi:hypothetical protein